MKACHFFLWQHCGVANGQTNLVPSTISKNIFPGLAGARDPNRISRLMETTKLPLRLSNDFLGIAEDFDMWWGLYVLLFFGKSHIHLCLLNPTP